MPDHPSYAEAPAAPAFSAIASFTGNPHPLLPIAASHGVGAKRTGEHWIVELEFDEADIVRTRRASPFVLDVWLAQATVNRQFSRSTPPGDDGFDLLSDMDPADIIVPEVP